MLRRKLLIRLGLLVCAFVLGAAGAIWKLQDVQADLDHANADARALIDGVQAIAASVSEVTATRAMVREPASTERTAAVEGEKLAALVAQLGEHPLLQAPGPAREDYRSVRQALPAFLAPQPAGATADSELRMLRLVQNLSKSLREFVAAEQTRVGDAFHATVIALTLAALVMVNVSIYVLLRTAHLVLKPVAALVSGSRELAAEHFEHRVTVDRTDEFAELAHAYNALAENLQSSELRKTETLRQLAVTLNHDLNNTMAIIELQLSLLDRRTGQDPSTASYLREIRAGLLRMSRTVASLKDIRRIVLVDYGGGQKMIDLARSVAIDESAVAPAAATPPMAGGAVP